MSTVSFPALEHIDGGSLSISSNGVEDVNIPALTTVDGSISIEGGTEVVTVNLGGLNTVSGDLLINSSLAILDELTLHHEYTVGGSIDIQSVHTFVGDVTIRNSEYRFVREEVIGDVAVAEDFHGSLDASTVLPGLQTFKVISTSSAPMQQRCVSQSCETSLVALLLYRTTVYWKLLIYRA